MFARLRRLRIARSCRDLSIQPLETLRLRLPAPHFCIPPRASHARSARLAHMDLGYFWKLWWFSLHLLHIHIGGRGLLDLVEICLFSPSKRCAFDFRHPTFAHPRANHTPGAPALRTWILATFGNCGGFTGLSGRVLGNSQNSPPTLRREFRKPRQRTASPRGGFSPRGLYFP